MGAVILKPTEIFMTTMAQSCDFQKVAKKFPNSYHWAKMSFQIGIFPCSTPTGE
jgi:hypothetical protein